MASESPGRLLGPSERKLRRTDCLRTSREFQNVSRRGQRASSSRFVVLVSPRQGPSDGGKARIGLTVSRRVGNAVVRNRVKRRLREWFRQSAMRAAGAFDWVVIARPAAAGLPSAALRVELEDLCDRALVRGKP